MIDLAGLPDEVTVRVGERREFDLPSYAGSGNRWSVTAVLGEDLADVAVLLGEAPPQAPADRTGTTPAPAIAFVPERLSVVGRSPGVGRWRLVLARSFGPPEPTAEHAFDITVVS